MTWLTVDIISKQMPDSTRKNTAWSWDASLLLCAAAAAAACVAKFMANNIFENYVQSEEGAGC